jgi:hypothetical protein
LSGCLEEQVAGGTGVGNPSQGEVTFALVATSSSTATGLAKPGVGGGSGLPPTFAAGSIQAANADSALTVTDAGGTPFTILRSLANVGEIRIRLPDGMACPPSLAHCESDELRFEGPYVADLIAGTLTPNPGPFNAPVGGYRRVDIRLEESKQPSADTALLGHAMLISGTFAYAGRTDRPFSIALDFNENARFEEGTAMVRESGANRLLVAMQVEKWLAAADITRCLDEGALQLDAQGGLRIDERNPCGNLEGTLKDGVRSSGDLRGEHSETRR